MPIRQSLSHFSFYWFYTNLDELMRKLKVFDSPEKAKEVIPVNTLKKVRTKTHTLCLAHTPEGFFVTDDACPHMHASLSQGRLNYLNELICPLHGYRYALNTGQECQNRTRDLNVYQVELNEEGLFILLPD